MPSDSAATSSARRTWARSASRATRRHYPPLLGARRRGFRLDREVREPAIEPLRQHPRRPAQQLEYGGQEQAAYDERVEEHRTGEAEAEQLDPALLADHERQEDADHDR